MEKRGFRNIFNLRGVSDMGSAGQLGGMDRRFSFAVENEKAVDAVFDVVSFEGEEAISTLYRFELLLISENNDIDESKVVNYRAAFTLSDGVEGKAPVTYAGEVREFARLNQIAGAVFYRAVLVPRLWKLDSFFLSEVYLDKKRPEIFKLVMDNAGLNPNDYDVKFKNDGRDHEGNALSVLPYICQYQESYLSFISRWAERLGTYWWYQPDTKNGVLSEKAVFSDVYTAHPWLDWELQYQPELLANPAARNVLHSLILETRSTPKKLTIMDYQHYRASQEIKGSAMVDPEGIGEVFLYGENLKDNVQANEIARLRAEAILCSARQYQGRTTAVGLRCGYKVKVNGHDRKSFNRSYLLTRIRHSGSQAGLLMAVGHAPLYEAGSMSDDFYRAEFTAIHDDVQYRSEMNHPWPKIYGTLNAFIDAEGSGEYAEVNEKGEYKIQVPFAATGKPDAHGSAWIRRATFYAGEEHGIYFPLHKGTEVLLSFINGNPDQPVILMAVPNSMKHCLVTSKNPTQAMIRTAGSNFIGMEDQKGRQGLLIESPTARTMIRLGDKDALSVTVPGARASNKNGLSAFTEDNIMLEAGNDIAIKAKNEISITSEAADIKITASGKVHTTSASETSTCLGPLFKYTHGDEYTFTNSQTLEITLGAAEAFTAGISMEAYLGPKIEYSIFTKNHFWSAFNTEVGFGLKAEYRNGTMHEIWTGMKTEVGAGLKTEQNTGIKTEKMNVKLGIADLELKNTRIVAEEQQLKISKTPTEIVNRNVNINTVSADIKESAVVRDIAKVKLDTSQVSLHSNTHIFMGYEDTNLLNII
jgi:type VI secretion system secreted protein VgrG